MIQWIKNKAIKWGVKLLKNQLVALISKHPDGKNIQILWENLYIMSTNDFLTYCTNTLSGENLNSVSFPEYLKNLIKPLKDDVESIIDNTIDGFDPR